MLGDYQTILVAVDGSKESELALNRAIDVAKQNKSQLILGYIIDTRAVQTPSGFEGTFTDEIVRQSKMMMDSYKEHVTRAGLEDVKVVIEYGSPKVMIAKDLPTEHHVDLIMIGATGLNAVERLFIGSVSEYVIRHAPCDVLVVRKQDED